MQNLNVTPPGARRWQAVLAVVLPALLVLGLLILLVSLRGGIEGAMARLASLLPVSYAFAAGMVASVNPCGVLMLPTYALYHLSTGQPQVDIIRRIFKGLTIALVTTAGFTIIFLIVGTLVTAGGQWLTQAFPWAGALIGIVMAALGIWLLVTRKTLALSIGHVNLAPRRNLGNAFLFGVVYAIGSLGCTLPIFLVVVGSALASGDLVTSFSQFIGYAFGMGTVIFIITVGTAIFQKATLRWLERFAPYVERFSAMFLIAVGAYLAVYWLFLAPTG